MITGGRTIRTVALAASAFALLVGPPAAAAESVESGWWTSVPAALAPDVAEGQLLVQGGLEPDAPVAYAGISFALADGEAPSTLVLQVAPNSGSTQGAVLSACPMRSPAVASHGDGAEYGPSYDCGTKADGVVSADGASHEFDVSGLAGGDVLDVAIVATRATDRVVFQKPDVGALRTTAAAVPDGAFGDEATGGGGAPAGALDAADLSLGAIATGGGTAPALDLPTLASPSPAPPVEQAAPAAPAPAAGPDVRRVAPVAAQQDVGGGSRSLSPFVFALLLLVAAGLWAAAGGDGAAAPNAD